MTTVALIPYWSDYSFPVGSLVCRDTLKLGGRALINYTIEAAAKVDDIDDVVVYASNSRILDFVEDRSKCKLVLRNASLDAQDVSIESIIRCFFDDSDAETVVLLHPKNPFLQPKTIATCLEKVNGKDFDSALVVTIARKFAWFRGRRLNCSLDVATPSLSDVEPVLLETSSVYVFTREVFSQTGRRIGLNPYVHEIGHFEGFELDLPEDYEVAELIVNSGFEISGDCIGSN